MSARAVLGGASALSFVAGLPLWTHASVGEGAVGRLSRGFLALAIAEAAGSLGLLLWALSARPDRAPGRALAAAERAVVRWPLLRLALIAGAWLKAAALLLLLAHVDVGRSWVLHLGGLASLLWWTVGVASIATTPRGALRGATRAIALVLAIAVAAAAAEIALRRRPDALPAPLLASLPAAGTDLYPQYLYEEAGGVGFRFRPETDIEQRVTVGEANLYVQQPGLIRPPPQEEAPQALLEARFRTDANGYRNAAPLRERYRVAVSGDSFTMLAAEPRPWPELLSERLGEPVLNLGFQGYGPQSAAAAIVRFGLPRRPERLILAYFEGNDLIDAENYEKRRLHGGDWLDFDRDQLGIAERSVLFQVLRHGFRSLRGSREPKSRPLPAAERPYPLVIEIAGRSVALSFSVGYTSRLALTRPEVESLLGFQAGVRALARLDEEARAAGARLTVAFLPTKVHAYLPSLPPGALEGKLGRARRARVGPGGDLLTLPAGGVEVSEAELRANVASLRDAMASALAERGIEMLDLTPAFQAEAGTGAQLYLTNDTHWTAAGHELAARVIGEHLARGR